MNISINSEYSSKESLAALKEFLGNHNTKELVIKHGHTNKISYGSTYGDTTNIDVEICGSLECRDLSSVDKVAQIINLFERLKDSRDLEFLKRYFEIKLKR